MVTFATLLVDSMIRLSCVSVMKRCCDRSLGTDRERLMLGLACCGLVPGCTAVDCLDEEEEVVEDA